MKLNNPFTWIGDKLEEDVPWTVKARLVWLFLAIPWVVITVFTLVLCLLELAWCTVTGATSCLHPLCNDLRR